MSHQRFLQEIYFYSYRLDHNVTNVKNIDIGESVVPLGHWVSP